jgi:hypothetical protein
MLPNPRRILALVVAPWGAALAIGIVVPLLSRTGFLRSRPVSTYELKTMAVVATAMAYVITVPTALYLEHKLTPRLRQRAYYFVAAGAIVGIAVPCALTVFGMLDHPDAVTAKGTFALAVIGMSAGVLVSSLYWIISAAGQGGSCR